jgi:membrane protease YdiL (CAAX protease family)
MKKLVFTLILATVLWAIMFSPLTASSVNFWWMMTGSATTLALSATLFNPGWWKKISFTTSNLLWGITIAIVLWGIFWTGDKIAQLLFHFARPQVDQIYGMKGGESAWLLTALMLFLIGPAEEIFWRGYIQQQLSQKWNPNIGFLITTAIYALVHASSFNFMLTMAALVAGVVWGLLYRFYPEKFGAIILSHALWDVAVFIWFPI